MPPKKFMNILFFRGMHSAYKQNIFFSSSSLVLDRAFGGIIVLHLPDKNIGGIFVLGRAFISSVDACRCHACTCL